MTIFVTLVMVFVAYFIAGMVVCGIFDMTACGDSLTLNQCSFVVATWPVILVALLALCAHRYKPNPKKPAQYLWKCYVEEWNK